MAVVLPSGSVPLMLGGGMSTAAFTTTSQMSLLSSADTDEPTKPHLKLETSYSAAGADVLMSSCRFASFVSEA